MDQQTVEDVLIQWLTRAYPRDRVPLPLIAYPIASALNVAEANVMAACDSALKERLITRQGVRPADTVIQLTDKGRQRGAELIRATTNVQIGIIDGESQTHIDQVVDAFRTVLSEASKEWARQVSRPVHPLHVYMAAKSLAAGKFAVVLDELDAARDHTGDADEQDVLLAAAFGTGNRP